MWLLSRSTRRWTIFFMATIHCTSKLLDNNPTQEFSTVTFNVVNQEYATLEVIDTSGRIIEARFSGQAQLNIDYRFQFDGSSLPNGRYLYRLITESSIINEKFMITR